MGTTATIDRPVRALPVPWELWVAALASVILIYLVFSENGAVLSEQWTLLHEVMHDGRHVIGVPCH